MSKVGVVAASLAGSLLITVLLAWVTWNYVFNSVDRVMVLMFFNIGSLSGQ